MCVCVSMCARVLACAFVRACVRASERVPWCVCVCVCVCSSFFRPSPASFPPPDGGGTRKVVQVRPGVIRSLRRSTVLIPPPAGGGSPEGVSDQSRAVAGGWLRVVAILSSVWHPNWRVSGEVLHCEPRTCGQVPPAPAVLSPEKNAPGICGRLFRTSLESRAMQVRGASP
jgi:hypothetical protein